MARLPLHALPAFRVVAQRGNLRAAADELHLTHSAISQQIRALEEQLGHPLFDRVGRSIRLNAAGAALLRSVQPALDMLEEGQRDAAAAAAGEAQRMRVTLLPSFAQRWLLPRMGRWRERHPDVTVELNTSQHVVDLVREGFHAALRQGAGPWRGLQAERLIDSPRIVVGPPAAAQRLAGRDSAALAEEPLLGDEEMWSEWFALQGLKPRINPVASFNDAGLMLQASEQGLGLGLTREVLAADALREGRLVRLSPIALPGGGFDTYWLVYPPALADWAPLRAFSQWLRDELTRSERAITPAGTAPAGPTGSRSPAPRARRVKSRAR